MENIRKQFSKELKNLEINEEETITPRLVEKRFKKKALRVHSDKTGQGDDEEFKELLNDYHRIIDAIEKIGDKADNEVNRKTDLHEFFEKHNFAKGILTKLDYFCRKRQSSEMEE